MAKEDRVTTAIRLPADLWTAIKDEASKQHISANSWMLRTLEEAIRGKG